MLPCAALVPLPSSLHVCWGISLCLLVGVLELGVTAGAAQLLFSQAFPGAPYWGKVNLEVNMITVVLIAKLGNVFNISGSFIPFPCQHCCILKRHNNMAAKQYMFQGVNRADKITAPVPQGSLRFNSEAKKLCSELGSIYMNKHCWNPVYNLWWLPFLSFG